LREDRLWVAGPEKVRKSREAPHTNDVSPLTQNVSKLPFSLWYICYGPSHTHSCRGLTL